MKPQLDLKYVDRPEVAETFVQSIEKMNVGEGLVTIELCVHRIKSIVPPNPPKGEKVTAARLVMALSEFTEMFNKLAGLVNAMEAQGLVKRDAGKVVHPPAANQ